MSLVAPVPDQLQHGSGMNIMNRLLHLTCVSTFVFLLLDAECVRSEEPKKIDPPAVASAAEIEEIRVADMNETIVMYANGSATHAYRGRWNWGLCDERVGLFRAKLDPREFRHFATLVTADRFDTMKDFYLP